MILCAGCMGMLAIISPSSGAHVTEWSRLPASEYCVSGQRADYLPVDIVCRASVQATCLWILCVGPVHEGYLNQASASQY